MPQPKALYRVICYELRNSHQTLIMDSTDDGFIAATGKFDGAVLDGEISHAGPQQLQAELALMIANDPQLRGKRPAQRKPTR